MQPMVNIALKAARKAARIIEHASDDIHHLTVDTKSPSDFVTEIDRAAEAEIIAILSKAYPDHAIISEETGTVGDPDLAEYTWLISGTHLVSDTCLISCNCLVQYIFLVPYTSQV